MLRSPRPHLKTAFTALKKLHRVDTRTFSTKSASFGGGTTSGPVRTRSAAWDAHHLLDELSEGAGFSGRCPSGREHGPEIDPGQFPILQHHLDRSICDLGREHPLRSDRDASIGKYSRAHSLRSTDAQPTFQCDRNFRIITLKGPVLGLLPSWS